MGISPEDKLSSLKKKTKDPVSPSLVQCPLLFNPHMPSGKERCHPVFMYLLGAASQSCMFTPSLFKNFDRAERWVPRTSGSSNFLCPLLGHNGAEGCPLTTEEREVHTDWPQPLQF